MRGEREIDWPEIGIERRGDVREGGGESRVRKKEEGVEEGRGE